MHTYMNVYVLQCMFTHMEIMFLNIAASGFNVLKSRKCYFSTTKSLNVLNNVTFYGNDLFSVAILAGLNQLVKKNLIKNLNVVTSDDSNQQHAKKDLKKNKVISYCKQNQISFHLWQEIKENSKYVEMFNDYDLAFVASFGYLLPSKLIDLYKNGMVNIHPSLLPRWRGASPLHYTILSNDQQTGVSLMKIMPKRFDVGPIIMQESAKLPENVTTLKLLDYTANLSVQMLHKYVQNYEMYTNAAKPQCDDADSVTYAHKLTSEMYNIDWMNQTCNEIDRLYRALHELSDLKTELNSKTVKLLNMTPHLHEIKPDSRNMIDKKLDMSKPPGYCTFIPHEKILAIRCKDGYVGFKGIIIKTKMDSVNFNNGYIQGRADVVFTSRKNPVLENIYKLNSSAA